MKFFLLAVLIAIIPTSVIATDYDESINIGQPSFYGQIDLGNNYPRPQRVYSEPVFMREVRTNSNNRYILAQNRYYESNKQYYDSNQDSRFDSHRGHDDYDQERRDNGKHKQGYDNNRGKYNKDRHDNKNRDRERRRN